MLDRTKHVSIKFIPKERISNHIRDPLFKNFDELAEEIFEVEKKRKTVRFDTAIQIGIAVYGYAKLNLICFWEFINEHLENDMYQILETDTDSLYIAFARETLEECVKQDKMNSWREKKDLFFASNDETLIQFNGQEIPLKTYDKRTPGKYKPEYIGRGMTCLNSKVYHVWSDKDSKTSCKGVQDGRNHLSKEDFLRVIETQRQRYIENAGIIKDGQSMITYILRKIGLSYFYCKRVVLADGVSTTHLQI